MTHKKINNSSERGGVAGGCWRLRVNLLTLHCAVHASGLCSVKRPFWRPGGAFLAAVPGRETRGRPMGRLGAVTGGTGLQRLLEGSRSLARLQAKRRFGTGLFGSVLAKNPPLLQP